MSLPGSILFSQVENLLNSQDKCKGFGSGSLSLRVQDIICGDSVLGRSLRHRS